MPESGLIPTWMRMPTTPLRVCSSEADRGHHALETRIRVSAAIAACAVRGTQSPPWREPGHIGFRCDLFGSGGGCTPGRRPSAYGAGDHPGGTRAADFFERTERLRCHDERGPVRSSARDTHTPRVHGRPAACGARLGALGVCRPSAVGGVRSVSRCATISSSRGSANSPPLLT